MTLRRPISNAQLEILSALEKGARLKFYKETGRWMCNLPNGMGFLVLGKTINALWARKVIEQSSAPDYDYLISAAGRNVLTEHRSY